MSADKKIFSFKGFDPMRNHPSVGVQIADILLPKKGIDLHLWATIACDQFTSQPEYWKQVAEIVGDAPSTFNLILPEVYLATSEETRRIKTTRQTMQAYLEQNILESHTGMIYVERTSSGKIRHGLLLALDLENYDYDRSSQSLIRATEGTILDRLPPRIRIREGAPLELPHILVLIDDPEHTVIQPLKKSIQNLTMLYDFELMLGSGHLRGYLVENTQYEQQILRALEKLASPAVFYPKYKVTPEKGVLLFAVGDGNHSLATAKAIWEKMKHSVGMDHPSRYALVEIENLHDPGLEFEPIHRVLFGLKQSPESALNSYFGDQIRLEWCKDEIRMIEMVNNQPADKEQIFGLITPQGCQTVWVKNPISNLPVGTLQAFLDEWLLKGGADNIDYVHGTNVLVSLSQKTNHCGFYLPAMHKNELFKTVILDGALPRKTFSMGEAAEKRFYVEARKII